MTPSTPSSPVTRPEALLPYGVRIEMGAGADPQAVEAEARALLAALSTEDCTDILHEAGGVLRLVLSADATARWAPGLDTTGLVDALGLDTHAREADLDREILLALLLAPVPLAYPSVAELASAIRIRRYTVQAARKTALAFDTEAAERPEDCWTYSEATGFVLRPGADLIDALRKATQPDATGKLYAFSCYRATEYVTLLGIAQELQDTNPPLYRRLQRQWEQRAIMSGLFHDVFLREYGSLQDPLPSRYYVPGDRLWFRNPDEASANAEGYEGSWVVYVGEGRYTNFWKRDQPFTLVSKCLEIYHWRDATYENDRGQLRVNDDEVDRRVHQTQQDPQAVQAILARMLRIRDPQGVYAEGGCIDATRECARWVRPGSADLALP
ncbi:putative lipoprotein [plant metagenome]|uniref:Putative lipoprotein n=1 Tax=plant metagenome TaxID=1297885 RepID=A0A484SD02_9ZZZZ